MLNKVLGTKFRIVQGYQGMGDSMLAVERGEMQGLCASYQQFRINEQLIKDGKLTFLLRAEEAPIPDIPDVPSIFDYAKTDEQRQLMRFVFSSTEFGRPYVFPPEVPQGSRRHHAQGDCRRGARSGTCRRGRKHQNGHDLHAAGSPGAARRKTLPDAAGA